MGGLAGCLENESSDDVSSGDIPEYARWVRYKDEISFMYADIRVTTHFEDDSEGIVDTEYEDPMITTPITAVTLPNFARIGLSDTGLDELISDRPDSGFETETDGVLLTEDAYVLLGDIDVDEIDDELTQQNNDATPTVYEQTDKIGDAAVYERADEWDLLDPPSAIAVNDEAIIVGHQRQADDYDSIDGVRRSIETKAGDGERAIDVEEAFRWVLAAAGDGHFIIAFYDTEPETSEEADQEMSDDNGSVTATLTYEDENSFSSDFAAVYDHLDDDSQAFIEDRFGVSADDVDHDFDNDRVVISATWDDEDLTG